MSSVSVRWALVAVVFLGGAMNNAHAAGTFEGRFFRGEGDVEYLELLELARRMYTADPAFQNMPMLYTPAWNGLVEGPTWGAWWIQNSYGPTYCALPFYLEPYTTFLQNSQDLWFDQMGNDERAGGNGYVAPDGSLCDAAAPGWIVYRQGDGNHASHDWGMEFTAAGVVLQAELLLISRDLEAVAHYLPKLERCANFIETRRDPDNNLFLAGAAGNLLAPSYAGWKQADGTFEKAYLAGLSVTYIAALDRLVELEKLAGHAEKADLYADRRDRAREGLDGITTDEGYFIKSLDPDGTRHGVYGAEKHGYFEASPNHDAIAFRVVGDAQAERIYDKIASIPLLRRHGVIIANEPGLDDMYDPGTSWLWKHGTWVNGGHWSTCEGRMMLGYYRLGKYADARRSMEHMVGFAQKFRMDNPLVEFGSEVYQPKQPVNLCYDSFGPIAGFIRGLFEYLYRADGLTLIPHVPPVITRLEQRFPIRFGDKCLFLATVGAGPVTAVRVNGKPWPTFDADSVFLDYDETPERAVVEIALGGAEFDENPMTVDKPPTDTPVTEEALDDWLGSLSKRSPNKLPFHIGANSDGQDRLVGAVDHIRVFDRALSAEEIASLGSDEPGALDDDPALVVHWSFDALHDGVFESSGSAKLPLKPRGDVEIVDSPGGKAANLERGRLETPHNPALDLPGTFTLEARIRPDKFPEACATIINKIPSGTGNGYLLDTYPKNALRVITPHGTASFAANLAEGQWYDVAATFDGNNHLRLFLDGKEVAAATGEKKVEGETFKGLVPFYTRLVEADLADCYEAQHARLTLEYVAANRQRAALLAAGDLEPLPEPTQSAADQCYAETALKLAQGLRTVLDSYADSTDPHKKRVHEMWKE